MKDGRPAESRGSVRSAVERGPVRVLAEVTPARSRLSDQLTLALQIETVPGIRVQKPSLGETIGDFLIRDSRELLPRIENDREIVQQIHTLEPKRAGELSLPPIRVEFTDARPQADEPEFALETERLPVEIESAVASDSPSLTELRPFADPVGIPAERGLSRWCMVVPLAALAAAVWLGWRRRRRIGEERHLSPQELARLELNRLLQRNLAATDIKQFYVELTGIVRRYIERSTEVRAPERTTEEFLREIAEKETFPADESRYLRQFLEAADLVKFAAHRPRDGDTDESLRSARRVLGIEPTEVVG